MAAPKAGSFTSYGAYIAIDSGADPCISSLNVLRERHQRAHPEKPFTEPKRRDEGERVRIVHNPHIDWTSELPPAWHELKAQFPADWLWDACNKAIERTDPLYTEDMIPAYTVEDKMELLKLALDKLRHYPHRPSVLLPSSSSIDRLRNVLHLAGRVPEIDHGNPVPGVDRHDDHELNVSWDWTGDYLDEVYRALISVITEHALGDSGWRSARWEVYDKVSPVSPSLTSRV